MTLSSLPMVTVRRGSMQIPAQLYAAHLAGVEGVALLRDGADLLIIPVLHAGAGGFLLKQSSPGGDRVIHAGPFFYDNGLDDTQIMAQVLWEPEAGRLVVRGLFDGDGANAADGAPSPAASG